VEQLDLIIDTIGYLLRVDLMLKFNCPYFLGGDAFAKNNPKKPV
jgi:hypothetical protein